MKLIHVCESITGGTGSYLAEIVPFQVREYGRANVALLVPAEQYEASDRALLSSGAQIFTFKRPSRAVGTLMLELAYLKQLASFQPDIVHAHSSLAGLITRVTRVPWGPHIVYCPHGWSVDKTDSRIVAKVAGAIERLLGRLPDDIIAISAHEHRRGIELGLPPDRLHLVPNGISSAVPAIAPAPWDDARVKVLFVGRFDRQKGVDILLEAVEELGSSVAVRLIGDYAVDQPETSKDYPPHVEHLGWRKRADVTAQMKAADVLVVPSRWEGFGLVAIEAMRVGTPVLATRVGGLVEIVETHGILVPPENPAAMKAALGELDAIDLAERGQRAAQAFKTYYTSDRLVRQLDGLYAAALGSRHDQRAMGLPAE